MWTTPEDVRLVLNVSIEELSDENANKWITKAQEFVRSDTGVRVTFDKLKGDIDGSNTKFYVTRPPIGDKDFDLSITASDISVYGLKETEDESTKEALVVSSIYPETGLVVLTSAPDPAKYKEIRADYWQSWVHEFPESIKYATALMSANFYMGSEFGMLPVEYRLGTMTLRYFARGLGKAGLPQAKYWGMYRDAIAPLRRKLIDTLLRDGMELEKREPVLL